MTARPPAVDLAVLREMAEACGWTLEEMARRYLEEARREARRLREALDRGALDEAARVAHGWSGASGMAGATAVGRLLERLERAAARGRAAEAGRLAARVPDAVREVEEALRGLVPVTPPPPSASPS